MARAGKAKYDAKKHALVWKIKRFTGAAEQILIANVELIATTKEKKLWSRPPISLTFQVCALLHLALPAAGPGLVTLMHCSTPVEPNDALDGACWILHGWSGDHAALACMAGRTDGWWSVHRCPCLRHRGCACST